MVVSHPYSINKRLVAHPLLREPWLTEPVAANGLRHLVDGDVVREGLIVSTCNRVEILSATASDQVEFGVGRLTEQTGKYERF